MRPQTEYWPDEPDTCVEAKLHPNQHAHARIGAIGKLTRFSNHLARCKEMLVTVSSDPDWLDTPMEKQACHWLAHITKTLDKINGALTHHELTMTASDELKPQLMLILKQEVQGAGATARDFFPVLMKMVESLNETEGVPVVLQSQLRDIFRSLYNDIKSISTPSYGKNAPRSMP